MKGAAKDQEVLNPQPPNVTDPAITWPIADPEQGPRPASWNKRSTRLCAFPWSKNRILWRPKANHGGKRVGLVSCWSREKSSTLDWTKLPETVHLLLLYVWSFHLTSKRLQPGVGCHNGWTKVHMLLFVGNDELFVDILSSCLLAIHSLHLMFMLLSGKLNTMAYSFNCQINHTSMWF